MPDGFKFGTTRSETLGLILRDKTVPFMPPIDDQSEQIAGKDGAWDFGVRFGAKQITTDVSIYANSRTALNDNLRELANVFNPRKGPQELIFDDEPDKLYYARLSDKFEPDKIGIYGEFELLFICHDPFTYAATETVQNGATQTTVDHLGSHITKPILTVTHSGGAATITNARADGITERITFKSSSPAGTYVIDNKEFTITINGAGAYQHFDETTFFSLPKGSNLLSWGANITNVEARFRHTWL